MLITLGIDHELEESGMRGLDGLEASTNRGTGNLDLSLALGGSPVGSRNQHDRHFLEEVSRARKKQEGAV
jgi:hypothetical protein